MSKALRIEPVTPINIGDFEALFDARGEPKGCWCMAWRKPLDGAPCKTSAAKKQAIMAYIKQDIPVGLLAYNDETPIAWCALAPRESFRKLGGVEDGQNTWSIACFYVQRTQRGQGVAKALLQAAINYARAQGAAVLEAYPVAPDSPSYRFMGFKPRFEKAGFSGAGMAGTRRNVMRLAL